MTMAANGRHYQDQSGQSLIEFVLMLPIMMIMTGFIYKGNILSQISINNQKYVRAQTFFLAFNSPYFPERQFNGAVFTNEVSLMELGMSDRVINAQTGQQTPTETKYPLLRAGQAEFGNPGQAEGPQRQTGTPVVRTNVAICTQPRWVNGQGTVPLSMMNFNSQEYPVNLCKGHQDE